MEIANAGENEPCGQRDLDFLLNFTLYKKKPKLSITDEKEENILHTLNTF